jgi:large subunit ribosomal protein L22
MEARAIARYVRVSTRKTNQVLGLVRGQNVESAMQLLAFTPKHVARTVLKTLKSAIANAIVLESRLNPEDLYVKECLVGPAPIMKRFLPRAQGRATPILKRSCHITIVVSARPGALDRYAVAAPLKGKAALPPATPADKKSAPAPKKAAAKGASKAAPAKKAGAGTAKTKSKSKASASAGSAGARKGAAGGKKKQKEKSPLRESKRG